LKAGIAIFVVLVAAVIVRIEFGTRVKEPKNTEELSRPCLDRADKECERAIAVHVKRLDVFFAASKTRTRAFADAATGWGSKRRLIQDRLPFTRNDRHQAFLRERFEELIFSPAQLKSAVEGVVEDYLADVRAIESKMLIDLRAGSAAWAPDNALIQLNDNRLQTSFDAAIAESVAATGKQLKADLGKKAVVGIADQVLKQAAIRLGVRAGILEAGAVSGSVSFGIGMAVGVIVDQMVAMIWDWVSDPQESLATTINDQLDEMNRLLVDGSADVNGLRTQLQELARTRAKARRTAAIRMLRP